MVFQLSELVELEVVLEMEYEIENVKSIIRDLVRTVRVPSLRSDSRCFS